MSEHFKNYYPSTNSRIGYALYVPGLDIFLIIDYSNLYVMDQLAKVLSSKILTAIIILSYNKKIPNINNENCHLFSLFHTKFFYGALSVADYNYSPAVVTLQDTKIVKKNNNFNKGEKNIIKRTQEYATFCLQCLHAINLSQVLHQQVLAEQQEKLYSTVFLKKEYKNLELTPIKEIMHILYHAQTTEEATEQIKVFWKKHLKNADNKTYWQDVFKQKIKNFIKEFYVLSKIEIPNDLSL
jgi:hypothetical protein